MKYQNKKQPPKQQKTITKPDKKVLQEKKDKVIQAKQEPKKGLKIKSPKKLAETEVLFCDASYEVVVANMFNNELNKIVKFKDRNSYQRLAKKAVVLTEACVVCNHITGLKTKCTGGEVVHIICGLLSDIFSIDYATMDLTLTDKIVQSTEKCSLCEKEGGQQLQCLKKGCKQQVHVFCLMEQRRHHLTKPVTRMEQDGDSSSEEDEEITGWQLQIKILDYAKQKYFNHYDCLQPLLENLDFLNVSKSEGMDLLTPENTPIIRSNQVSTLQNKRPARINLPKRGGKVSIVCENHRSEQQHCYCGNRSQTLHMLMCDYCQKWFHTKCEGLKSTEAQLLKEYKCTHCLAWSEKVDELITPALKGSSTEILFMDQIDFLTWESWKRSILPNKGLQVKLSDCILIAQIWQKQTNQLLSTKTNIELIKQQILVAQHIPLRLDVSGLNSIIKQVCLYQKGSPYSLQKLQPVLKDDKIDTPNLASNQSQADRVQVQIQKELDSCKVVSNQADELQFSVISQNQLIRDAIGALFECRPVTYDRLEQMTNEIDAEVQIELIEKINLVFKDAKKWITQSSDVKGKTVTEVKNHISKKPSQVNLSEKVQKLEEIITSVEVWEQDYRTKSGLDRFNHVKTINGLKLKSDFTESLQCDLKSIGMDSFKLCFSYDRQTRCKSALKDTIQKALSNNSEIARDLHKYLDSVHQQVNKLEEQISSVISGNLESSSEYLLQLCNSISEMPILVPGEVQLNQAIAVIQFVTGKNQNIDIALLRQMKCKITGEEGNSIEDLKNQVEAIDNKIKSCNGELSTIKDITSQSLTSVRQNIKELQKHTDDMNKINVVMQGQEYKKLQQFLEQLQNHINSHSTTDTEKLVDCLQNSQKEYISQNCSLLGIILKGFFVGFCPFLTELKQYLTMLKKKNNVGQCLQGRVSLKKLQEMLTKCCGDSLLQEQINNQLTSVNSWYEKFNTLQMTDAQLRKKLANKEYENLLKLVEQLETEKETIKLDVPEIESKLLQKIKKWATIVRDCHRVMTEEFEVDELFALLQILKELKSFPQEIPICKDAQERISQVKQLTEDIDKIALENKPDTLQQLRERLIQAASVIRINIDKLVKEYNKQIDACDNWVKNAQKDDCDELALLKQLKDDTEEDLNLVSDHFVTQVRIKAVKKMFEKGSIDVKQFIIKIDKIFGREILNDEELKLQKSKFELARKVKKMLDSKKPVDFTTDEASMISQDLPFEVPQQCLKTLKEMSKQLSKIESTVKQLLNSSDTTVEQLKDHFGALKKLQIRSQTEDDLEQILDDIEFTVKLSQMISDLNNNNIICYDDLKRVQTMQSQMQMKCPEADLCVNFLVDQQQKFDSINDSVVKLKNDNCDYTYQQLFDAQLTTSELKVDFQKKERVLRTIFWNLRLEKFIKELAMESTDNLEVIQSDLLSFWLEDAQELDLAKDPKYEILNDKCDLVDQCQKAFKQVTTKKQLEELTKYIKSELCQRLSFSRAETEVKFQVEEGAINPKAYLEKLLKQKKDDSDVLMTNADAESSDDTEDELSQEEEVVKDKSKQPTRKREVKAADKNEAQVKKVESGSNKKIEDMKKKIGLNKAKKESPEVKNKKDAVIRQPAAVKKEIKKKVIVETIEAPKGLAGGLKIGGGIKQKLGSFKKKPIFTSPSGKVQSEEQVSKLEPVEETIKADQVTDKAEETKKSVKVVTKKPVAAVKPIQKQNDQSKDKPKPQVKEKPVDSKGAKKDVKAKPVANIKLATKKPTAATKQEDCKQDQETDSESPKPAAKSSATAAVVGKPIIGIKRKPLGGLAASLGSKPSGLAASLKKLN